MNPVRFLHPRLTVLVTCKRPGQAANIISVAWCMPMSMSPALVGIAIKEERYSYKIIAETKAYTVNIPDEKMVEQVMWIGRHSGADVNKFAETGLTPMPGHKINVPYIKECIAHLECLVKKTMRIGDHIWFIGEVVFSEAAPNTFINGRYHPSAKILYYYLDGWFATLDPNPRHFG
ncbi:MAG: flavin reductase family protein [Candidatus Ranarchaeia archaeon]